MYNIEISYIKCVGLDRLSGDVALVHKIFDFDKIIGREIKPSVVSRKSFHQYKIIFIRDLLKSMYQGHTRISFSIFDPLEHGTSMMEAIETLTG